MTCEDMRSELKRMRRKSSGTKNELLSRLREVGDENDKGWLGRQARSGQCQWGDFIAAGAERNVYASVYTKGPRKGESAVIKLFKTGSVFERKFFEKDLMTVQKAASLIKQFNDLYESYTVGDGALPRFYLNVPEVWDYGGKKCLVEPRIPGTYLKFNSNSGWVRDPSLITEALSHFTYHISGGQYLLCDLQGGQYSNRFVLTDPAVHSSNSEFGPTDGGKTAMKSFFSKHRCNRFCQEGWRRAAEYGSMAAHVVRSGTTFFPASGPSTPEDYQELLRFIMSGNAHTQ